MITLTDGLSRQHAVDLIDHAPEGTVFHLCTKQLKTRLIEKWRRRFLKDREWLPEDECGDMYQGQNA